MPHRKHRGKGNSVQELIRERCERGKTAGVSGEDRWLGILITTAVTATLSLLIATCL